LVTGAILAGGTSRRFGRNKALEVFREKRLINHYLEGISRLCDPFFVVANDLEPYLDLQATVIRDLIPHRGPIVGIRTALISSPHERVFIKAADMPFLVPEFLRMMLDATEDADLVVPVHGKVFEPLFGLYNRRCIPAIAGVLETDERSVTAIFEKVRLKTIGEEQWRIVDDEGRSFLNVNTPEDWAQLISKFD
jgi:molybdopterin-guanine dinucleotide biosynthesis protein A